MSESPTLVFAGPDPGSAPAARSRQSGFTLVEIMVGIAILVTGLMGLSFAMVTSNRVERVATEKKIALTWITSQIERVRTLGFSEIMTVPNGTQGGYLVPAGNPASPAGFRMKETTSGPLYFERWFHKTGTADYTGIGPTITLSDPLLNGLVPVDGMEDILTDPNQERWPAAVLTPQKYMRTLVGRVIFRMPEPALNGVGPGSGYWVTARVMWKGASGPSEMKITTFVGR